MKDPVTVEIGARRSPAETINHVLYPVAEAQKRDLLVALMENHQLEDGTVRVPERLRDFGAPEFIGAARPSTVGV